MDIDSKKDLRLISRAMREEWKVDRAMVIQALQEVIQNRDPDLMIDAAKLLMKADEINMKREAIQQRELSENDDHRLRLIELANKLPVGELARLASSNGIAVDGTESEV